MRKKIISVLLILCFAIPQIVKAGEGMWLPIFLKSLNEKEMRKMGMKMSAEDIYSVNKGSLKDAIVHFGGFCTSEIISPDGLLLTNHHCGYSQIQRHSTVENNLLKNGFWAEGRDEELSCPGLSATFIVKIEDITEAILQNVPEGADESKRNEIIDENIALIRDGFEKVNYRNLQIKPFYQGNQYFAIETVTYPDVRLVGNPPESIGKFGADTDNWIWPRHTGDFAFFRIYADQNNDPAEYSESNIPYNPRHFLPISVDGVEEDDFTLVFGFPGRTNEYLPAVAVDQIANVYNPARIEMRDVALKAMDRYMRKDEEIRLQYASKFARIANYWKKWQGESLGLKKTNAIQKKQDYEAQFLKKVNKRRKYRNQYSGVLEDLRQAYKAEEDHRLATSLHYEFLRRNVEIFRLCRQLSLMEGALENYGDQEFDRYKQKFIPQAQGFFDSYRSNIDKEVMGGQISAYKKYMPQALIWPGFNELLRQHGDGDAVANHLFTESRITTYEGLVELTELSPEKFVIAMVNDPLMSLYKGIEDHFNEVISPVFKEKQNMIDELQRKYMKAQMDVFSKKERFYPDANGSLRVTYGKVQGYSTEEAGNYHHMTYLEGVVDKYIPGDYEFDVPQKLLDLYESKDYGQYAAEDGRMPVCFIGSNHTSGGNSGSPAIDAYGNLVGLNFDRVWEGTMSDIHYDISLCRNIMVDIRYVLFIVDKFAGAEHLIKEMKLVNPKKG
ncbi:MAG: S46 family peptidase [Saprospiraceae bacterium]|nr:S46 family peptidase [Saprospiraceae bacterium]